MPALRRNWPVLQGVLPVRWSWQTLLAGVTLAALAVPQAMGYAKIARNAGGRRPVHAAAADGGYRSPGFSFHLVVAADSRPPPSWPPRWPGWRPPGQRTTCAWPDLPPFSAAACCCWPGQPGSDSSPTSGTVLVGFLAGLGIQVAAYQVPDMIRSAQHRAQAHRRARARF